MLIGEGVGIPGDPYLVIVSSLGAL